MNILKAELIKRDIKMKDFAKEVGISPVHLSRIARGKNSPRKDLMIKISKALGISVQELFFSDDEEENKQN